MGKKCKPKTKKNRRKKRCKYQKKITTLKRSGVAAGPVSIGFKAKVGKRKLARGSYQAKITFIDAAGNRSKSVIKRFKVVRR